MAPLQERREQISLPVNPDLRAAIIPLAIDRARGCAVGSLVACRVPLAP